MSAVRRSTKTKIQIMKKITLYVSLTVLSAFLAVGSVRAAEAKSYQATGHVLEVTDSSITIKKHDDEKWQIASDKATSAKVKVGDKVTIQYQMVAKSIEVKSADPKPKADKK